MTSRVVRFNGKVVKLFCAKEDIFYAAYLRKEGEDIVHRVEKYRVVA